MKLAYKEDPLPKYIAVEGPIGVGKTTLANKLAKSFNYDILLEMQAENPFLEASYKNPTQSALSAQLFFLFQRVQQMEELKQRSLFARVVFPTPIGPSTAIYLGKGSSLNANFIKYIKIRLS